MPLAARGPAADYPVGYQENTVQLFQQSLPHRLPEELLHEAARIAEVPAALYLVGLDGSCLVRLAGDDTFPERLPAPQALGPEVAPESYPELNRALQKR